MRALVLCAAGLLAACGDDDGKSDGGPDSDTDVDTDVDTDTDVDGGFDPAVCEGLARESEASVAAEEELLGLVNGVRETGIRCGAEDMPAVPPFAMHHSIRCASRLHAQQVAASGNCDDDGAAAYEERFRSFEYYPTRWSGTITCEAATAQDAYDGFMALPGTCRLILSNEYEDFGVGRSEDDWSIGFGSTRR